MKKVFTTSLAAMFVLAATLTSCKDGDQQETETTEVTSEQTTSEELTTDGATTTTATDSTATDAPGTNDGEMEQVP